MSRVTLTEKQFALFSQPVSARAGAPRVKKRKEDLPENQLEKQCLDFLRVRGWIVDRQQSGLFKGPSGNFVRVGEKGCFDWIALKPWEPHRVQSGTRDAKCEVCYLELKAPGKKPDAYQQQWARRRRAAGFICAWFDGYSEFLTWYRGRFGE